MTLLKLFNKALEELPSISKNLEHLIMTKGWSEEKSQQAVKIVRQLNDTHLVKVSKGAVDVAGYDFVTLSELMITLSPRECGINNATTFGIETYDQADQYIKDLLSDINYISEDVKFSLRGHSFYSDKWCEFYISWEI